MGATVVSTLREHGHQVNTAGRNRDEDDVVLDLSAAASDSLEQATRGYDVVLNASGVENVSLGRALGDAVLIAELQTVTGDSVDVAVRLGSGEKHGAAALAWTARLVGNQITDPVDPDPVYNFAEHRVFNSPSGRRRYVRADLPDQMLIGQDRGLQVRSWLSLSNTIATRSLGLVRRAPWASGLIKRMPAFGSQDWAVTAVNRTMPSWTSMTSRHFQVSLSAPDRTPPQYLSALRIQARVARRHQAMVTKVIASENTGTRAS